ncbi:MAG: carbohydrate-binding protein [Planctomycetota bacterium]
MYTTVRLSGGWVGIALVIGVLLASCTVFAAEQDGRMVYARELLSKVDSVARFDLGVDPSLGAPEAFSVTRDSGDRTVVVGGGPAGVLYGVQYCLAGKGTIKRVSESPDFSLRGTALFWMKDCSYDYELTPREFPWFYDRELLMRYLDYLFENRINAIFLWSGFVFPSLVELPEYPDARTLTREQLLANQEQFRWFTDQCAKRNISVLTHFYNIHLTKALAASRKVPLHYSKPDEFAAKFIHYNLVRFLTEFASVGLYVCPGEKLQSEYQPEWIRDVILKAAEDSGRNPWVVVRDWGLSAAVFKEKCHYDNLFTELKHNCEMMVSPSPDPRHALWVDGKHKHIVNLHEASDVKPFRWGSPVFIQEMVREWKKAGLDGAELYGRMSWRWPYTLDKLSPDQKRFWPAGPKLLTFERDAIWLEAFGRYLWKADRDPQSEASYWGDKLGTRFGSAKAGELLRDWYNLTGPVLPGLQNLTSVVNMNTQPTTIAKEQSVDAILASRKSIEADLEANRGRLKPLLMAFGQYPSRPVDGFFLDRYQREYELGHLRGRFSIPVAEYAEILAKGQQVTDAMTPDKMVDLLITMARESEALAGAAEASATRNKEEVSRYVTDSRAIRLLAEYYGAKVKAALEKRLWQLTGEAKHEAALFKHLNDSVAVYGQLVALTDKTYVAPSDLSIVLSWHRGLKAAEDDVARQKQFMEIERDRQRLGFYWIEAGDMEGAWARSMRYPGYFGANYRFCVDESQRKVDLTKTIELAESGKYNVWVHALIGGDTPDRALSVRVGDVTFGKSHGQQGPRSGKFVWHNVGRADLPAGKVTVTIKAVGSGIASPDVVVLIKDAWWHPPQAVGN